MKKYLTSTGLILLVGILLATSVFASGFTDTQGHWAEASIDRWAEAGIVNGVGEGSFDPDSPLTLGQTAQILSRLFNLTESADLAGITGITGEEWYAEPVAQCLAAGLLTAENNEIHPEEQVSRGEFFVLMAKALGVGKADAGKLAFKDADKLSPEDAGTIVALVEMGVVKGVDVGVLAPEEPITRASALTVLDRLIGVYINKDGKYEASRTGVTLVAAKNVELTGDGPRWPVVVSAAGAQVDLSAMGPGVDVDVLADGVSILKAPGGITVSARTVADGTTLDGETVEAGKSLTRKVTSIAYEGAEVTLSEKALYVNASLTAGQCGEYAFASLQDCVAAAKDGKKGDETDIYLAPDVYWTDDYANPAVREKDDLVGLTIPQRYICLVGVTGDRDDVVIASDRGQNAGANGNFNTLAISDGFHAKDMTFANYCNVDLVYERDPSKNHEKRQGAIVQAQVITKAAGVDTMDEWFFEDCAFVSRLNVFSNSLLPYRTLYVGCHFESTDDSIGTGYISVFQDCDFDFYSNTPSGSASEFLQAYLNCDFRLHFADEGKLNLSKHSNYFVIMDTDVTGTGTGVQWKDGTVFHDTRSIVSGNTMNGQPLTIAADNPEYSVTPGETLMTAFKVGDEYNVYNLLNSAAWYTLDGSRNDDSPRNRVPVALPEWDPLGQKDTLGQYAAPWGIRLYDPDGVWEENSDPVLMGDGKDELKLEPVILGKGDARDLTWTADNDALKIDKQADGSVVITAVNYTYEEMNVLVTATAPNGLYQVLHVTVNSPTLEAPQVKDGAALTIASGDVDLSYALTDIPPVVVDGETAEIDPALNPDASLVEWYRGTKADGSDKLLVAVTTYVLEGSVPKTTYTLTEADVGSYITAVITPGYLHSEKGQAVTVITSRAVTAQDVIATEGNISVDFSELGYNMMENASAEENYEWDTSEMRSGFWYGGFYLPAEYREGGIYAHKAFKPAGERPWTFADATNGAAGTAAGLQTTTQGARLVYVDDTPRGDMTMTITMAPHKNAGQGFGSANQFLDIYIKYDARTMTGYGLRITREEKVTDEKYAQYADYLGKCCSFQLMEFKNGVATPLSEKVYASAFNPESTVVLSVKGKTISATVTTTKAQDSSYPEFLKNEVSLEATLEEVNTFGGYGFQHTGTAGEGKSGNRVTISGMILA